MSEKVVEATGNGRVNLTKAVAALGDAPSHGKIQPSIARVRVQKVRNGVVYEDRVIEYERNGFHR